MSDWSGLCEFIEYDDVWIIEKYLCFIFVKWVKKFDLFMYIEGGDVIVICWIVVLIREFLGFDGEFLVFVFFKCMSVGIEISLGVDNIIMGKVGYLGFVDI